MSHRHKSYSSSHCIPPRSLVSYLFLPWKGKGRNTFIWTLSTKQKAMSLDIRCLFSLLFKQLQLWQGIQNPYIPLPVLTLPEAFSHNNFKTGDNSLWKHLSNREVGRIAGVISIAVQALWKADTLNTAHFPGSSSFCISWQRQGDFDHSHLWSFSSEKDAHVVQMKRKDTSHHGGNNAVFSWVQ